MTQRTDPKRNSYGQYLLKDPNGKERAHQRTTTFCSTIAETRNLNLWHQRNVAIGLVKNPNLFAMMGSYLDPQGEDKSKVNELLDRAREAAGASLGSDTGTALHSYTQQVDEGLEPNVPAPWDKDVRAYSTTLAKAGIKIIPEYVERTVAVDDLLVGGTFDRIIEIDGRLMIADLKTGKDPISYPHEICCQLGVYANATTMYTLDWEREPMPDVDKEQALVIHLPPGKAECKLYYFDIAAGWAMVEHIEAVKDWRKTKALVTDLNSTIVSKKPAPTPIKVVPPENPTDTQCQECGTEVKPGFAGLSKTKHGVVYCNVHYGQKQTTA